MMVYLITKQLKCPLQRSSYDEGHVVGRSYGCLEIAPCGEAYTRAASARIVRSEDGHPLGWPLLFCSLSPVTRSVCICDTSSYPTSRNAGSIGRTCFGRLDCLTAFR